MKVPVIYFAQPDATAAFEVMRALEQQEREDPKLAENTEWRWMRDRARQMFMDCFQVAGGARG